MENFIGEIRIFCGNFAPYSWLDCDGSLVSIAQYDTLFNLIGTTYGGDGQQTFGLPDLRGRAPVHQGTLAGGQSYPIGAAGGTEQVTLINAQMPTHTHGVNTASSAQAGVRVYSTNTATTTTLTPQSIGPAGGNQPHDNMQPFQVIRYIIATEGIYPTQN